jgi:hypothetical protein
VRDVRRLRRGHERLLSAVAWRAYLGALSAKWVAFRKAKAVPFKQAIANAARIR